MEVILSIYSFASLGTVRPTSAPTPAPTRDIDDYYFSPGSYFGAGSYYLSDAAYYGSLKPSYYSYYYSGGTYYIDFTYYTAPTPVPTPFPTSEDGTVQEANELLNEYLFDLERSC